MQKAKDKFMKKIFQKLQMELLEMLSQEIF